jgi:hypothetical protein
MPTPTLDGTLLDWAEISGDGWEVILLGNGVSINVWPEFEYSSLFDYARDGGGLRPGDLALFDATPNFERVLGDLATAIRVSEIAGVDPAPFYRRYRRIQRALGHAIRQVHPSRSTVQDEALSAIREELLKYEWIFTTSYDLILYWAMGRGPRETYAPFIDHFRYGGRCEFDPRRTTVMEDQIPVYFLHGALHLVVGGTGVTWKLRSNLLQTLLNQFGQPIAGDPHARPLLVTEGSARDKLTSIEANDYLSHSLALLGRLDLPVMVFGSSLSAEDQHLIDALNEYPRRKVAVSLLPGTRRAVAATQADIYSRLKARTLLFFDATTHPLGDTDLCAA